MKLSLHLILWSSDPNPKGQYPIYVRITIDRKPVYLSTGEFVFEKQWDSKNEQVKNHPLEVDINARNNKLIADISRKFTELTMAGKEITGKKLKSMFQGGKSLNNLFAFKDAFIKEVEHKREPATLENYRKHLLKLEQYHGSQELTFEQITPEWLANYESYLRKEELGNNYVHALFKTLKLIFNAAIKKGLITEYPFDKYENPIYKPPIKDYLTNEEIGKWEEIADNETDPVLLQTAIYFLLGVSTGLRISDWFRFSPKEHIRDNQVLLRAKKNGEWVTMPVNALLRRNIKRMAKVTLSIEEPTINEKLKKIAIKAGITKHITSHTGRHTFAITLCADRGVSCETCSELMGITVKTCVDNYYRVSNRKINKETLKAWKGL